MSSNFIRDFIQIALPKRALRILLLAIAVSVTGGMIAALSHGTSVARRPPATAAAVPAANPGIAATLLPTVVVRPQAEATLLATIKVRPDHAGPASVHAHAGPTATDPDSDITTASLSGGGFGMPYYSFGRTLHHASKE